MGSKRKFWSIVFDTSTTDHDPRIGKHVFPIKEIVMKKVFLLAFAFLPSVGTASAAVTTQKWTDGWDNFGEPLDKTRSTVEWSVNPSSIA